MKKPLAEQLVDYQDWTKRQSQRVLKFDFVRFGIVGAGGFLVNSIMLYVLYGHLHLPILIAQLIGAETALLFNFTLHNNWTYKTDHQRSLMSKLISFHASSWVGVLITTVVVTVSVRWTHLNYFVGLIIGSAIAMLWNYLLTRFVIFKEKSVTP